MRRLLCGLSKWELLLLSPSKRPFGQRCLRRSCWAYSNKGRDGMMMAKGNRLAAKTGTALAPLILQVVRQHTSWQCKW